jgi:predicted permease
LIGLVGYVLDKRGWFTLETKAMLPRLVTQVTLPPYLFGNIFTTFKHDDLLALLYGSVVPLISIIITFGISVALAKIMEMRPGRSGIFLTGFSTSNTIFIGLPVNLALFGEAALPYVLLYFFANTIFFWTIGNYCISRDGDRPRAALASLSTLRLVFSPPLLGFILGVSAVMISLPLPSFCIDAATYIGGMTTPLAIIFIGITLAGISLKNMTIDRDVLALLFGRFVISPATIILLMRVFELPTLMAKVFVIQSSLPMGTTAVLLAAYYRADAHYASMTVSLSTILSMITVPLYMVILSLMAF